MSKEYADRLWEERHANLRLLSIRRRKAIQRLRRAANRSRPPAAPIVDQVMQLPARRPWYRRILWGNVAAVAAITAVGVILCRMGGCL